MKTPSINFLRGLVKNANLSLVSSNDQQTKQQLVLARESAYSALKMFQRAKETGDAKDLASAFAFAASHNVPLSRKSGKDASTWDADIFSVKLKARYGDATLARIAEKQENGIEHGDIAVVRNLYGTGAKRAGNKVLHSPLVTPTVPSRYKDKAEKQADGTVKVIGKPMPLDVRASATDVAEMMARAEATLQAIASKPELSRADKAARTRAKKLLALAKTAKAYQSEARADKAADTRRSQSAAKDALFSAAAAANVPVSRILGWRDK